MALSYSVTQQGYVRALARRPEQRTGAPLIALGLAVCGLGAASGLSMAALAGEAALGDGLPLILGAGCFYLAMALFLAGLLPGPRTRRKVRRQLKSGALPADFFGPHQLSLGGGTLELAWGGARKTLPCVGLRCENALGGLFLCAGATIVEFVPDAAFTAPEEKRRFQQAVAAAAAREVEPEPVLGAAYTLDFTWEQAGFVQAAVEGCGLLVGAKGYWTPGKVLLTVLTGGLGSWLVVSGLVQAMWGRAGLLTVWLSVMLGLLLAVAPNVQSLMAVPFFGRSIFRNQIKHGLISPESFQRQVCTLGEGGLTVQTLTTRVDYQWPQVTHCAWGGGALILILEGRRVYPIAGSAFESERQREAVEAYIRLHAGLNA